MTGIGGTLTQNSFADFLLPIILLTGIGGTFTENRFVDFLLIILLMDLHWWDLKTKPKPFCHFSANINTIGLLDMNRKDINTIPFRQFFANNNTYGHALVGPQHKTVSPISC